MSICMKNFYFPLKLLKCGFVAMPNSEKSLVLACCITNNLDEMNIGNCAVKVKVIAGV